MKSQLRVGMVALGLLGAVYGTAWAGTYEDGMTAFRDEDYAKALSLLMPFAKEGNSDAAYLIGEMYGPRS